MDGQIATNFLKLLSKQGLEFKLGTKFTDSTKTSKGYTLSLESVKDSSKSTVRDHIDGWRRIHFSD